MSLYNVTHALCSLLVICKDMDVGFKVLDDLQKKNRCINFRIGEIVDNLKAPRSTRLHLMYVGMGLEDPSAPDMDCMRAFLHEIPMITLESSTPMSRGFVVDVGTNTIKYTTPLSCIGLSDSCSELKTNFELYEGKNHKQLKTTLIYKAKQCVLKIHFQEKSIF